MREPALRRALILVLLWGGMQLLLPLGGPTRASAPLLAFGFLILAAQTIGEIATSLGLPRIVGYLLAGVAFGPAGLGVVSETGVSELGLVSQLAVALIAFLAGCELRWEDVRRDGPSILRIMTAEMSLTFVVMVSAILLLAAQLPFLADVPRVEALAFALVFGAVCVVHSPAVTMALLAETGARGPVSRATLGIVLVSDIVVVLVFSMALAFARSVAEPSADAVAPSLAGLLWEIGGSPVVGVLLGLGISFYLRHVGHELMLFAVIAVFLGLELTQALHVETLLTLLVAGFVVENTSVHGDRLRASIARSAAPLFVVFFALSGARIDVAAVASAIPVVLTLALLRAGSIAVGTHVGGWWAGAAPDETRLIWMGLVSQAGVAIGLTAVLAEAYPVRGLPLASLLLAIIAVNELVGPVLFRRALVRSGEAVGT